MHWTDGVLFLVAACLLAVQALPRAAQTSSQSRRPVQVDTASQSPAAPSVSATPHDAEKRDRPEFFIMIDPGHGGEDHGTTLPGKVQEKDVTLMLARQLRRQCEERGIPARLLRESDVNLSLERRAELTNQDRAGVYISLHAGAPGNGVRIYTAAIPVALPASGRFLSWDAAQSAALQQSRMLARKVSDELRRSSLQVTLLTAPLRPLNNVAAPAISVEWAANGEDFKPQQTAKAISKLTSALAEGIAQARSSFGASR